MLERLHDYKAHLWFLVRRFFRGQFTDDARDDFRERQATLVSEAAWWSDAVCKDSDLNDSQLVRDGSWKHRRSGERDAAIAGGWAGGGVYLIEATDGTYKAYTVAIVTSIAVVERANNGEVSLYVADRKTAHRSGSRT